MKFHEIPVGQRFDFEGERYVKISPLMARGVRDGDQKLFRRSANVALAQAADVVGPQNQTAPRVPLDSERVLAALDAFSATCVECLDHLAPVCGGDAIEACRRTLEAGRQAFLESLTAADPG